MKNTHLVLAFVFLQLSMIANAQMLPVEPTVTSGASLRDEALQENKVDDTKKKAIPTDARVEGMLTLKDPRPAAVDRSWKYLLHLSMQEYKPSGQASTIYQDHFDMGQDGSAAMPAVAIGFVHPGFETADLGFRWGLEGKVAYASANAHAYLASSNMDQSDAHLNTLMLSADPFISMNLQNIKWLDLILGVEVGSLTYTQTSSNDIATFTRHGSFTALDVGLDFAISKSWGITTEYARRQMIGHNTDVDVQKNNFEIGTRVTW